MNPHLVKPVNIVVQFSLQMTKGFKLPVINEFGFNQFVRCLSDGIVIGATLRSMNT